MKDNFTKYRDLANDIKCDTQVAGRYSFQKEDERRIAPDVFKKLDLQSSDNLLEIGCGTGNLLIPLSFYVDKAVGIDNEIAINRMLNRVNVNNLEGVVADFLNYDIGSSVKFEKILIYSVLHCLPNRDTVYSFVDKALQLLTKNGILLLGDIPNITLKNSFLKSDSGRDFHKQWQKRTERSSAEPTEISIDSYIFNDKNIFEFMEYIKAKGYKVYLKAQPPNLPFGHTREDIVITNF
jgi:SAM-dependent methyltransferase